MTTWPSDLPQFFLAADFRDADPDEVLRSKSEIGPDILRRRSSSTPRAMTGTMHMTGAQYNAYRTFYHATVRAVMPFEFPNPYDRGTTTLTVRFTKPPECSVHSPSLWRVPVELEVLP